MKRAEISIYLDKNRPRKNGSCSVKIRVTFNRQRKYFATGINLTDNELETVLFGKRRTPAQKEIKQAIEVFENKALKVIKSLNVFTFAEFTDRFLDKRNTHDSVSFAFDKYIHDLKSEERIKTATDYNTAKNSLEKFKKNLKFSEITPKFLKNYENQLVKKENKSISTVGFYLRSLKAIYNAQEIEESIYPFGSGKNKYTIPTSKNIKKALTAEEINKLYNYDAEPNSREEMARDYWFFMYLCNGINVKDVCLLKWKDIENNIITYNRAKTRETQREKKIITVSIKPETLEIIKKWGQRSLNKDAYVFPHFSDKMDAVEQNKIKENLTKILNKYMKRIADKLEIQKKCTTYFARHSFATTLKRSGAKTEMISDLLGHSNLSVTENYLDSFENDQIHKATDVLTAGLKKAN